MKTFIIIAIASLTLGNRCSSDAPPAPKDIKLYLGDSELKAICRLENDVVKCIPSDDVDFNDYLCMNSDDHEKVLNYIIELNDKCIKWRE